MDFDDVADICRTRVLAASDAPKRLFHGRGDRYPGFADVNVDWYAPYVVVSVFSERSVQPLVDALTDAGGVEGIVVQSRKGRATNAEVAAGTVPETFVCEERGMCFRIDPFRNQNVGLFLDIEPVRSWVRDKASGARILNLFAYTCGFSVAALAGGAAHVVNNDMSRSALDWGRENHRLNRQDLGLVTMVPHNVFKSWGKLKALGPYDIVIVDPPTRQRGSFVAERDYGQVMKRLPSLVRKNGIALVCLNAPFIGRSFIEIEMTRRCPEGRLEGWLDPAPEFEEVNPDAGLKVGVYRF